MSNAAANETGVRIELSKDEALVLFELLSRLSEADSLAAHYADRSEGALLDGILADLERVLVEPFDPNYGEILKACRERINRRVFGGQ